MNNGKFIQTDFFGKKIVIVGLGVSGLSAAKWLAKQKADVIISEIRPEADMLPEVCKEAGKLGVILETGGHNSNTFLNAEMIIISPGVPNDMDLIKDSIKRGIPVMGELEFASRLMDTPIIAVTGTNGKSTVTTFLGCMLKNAGLDVFVGGNIGTPLMDYVSEGRKVDYVVAEVSSFQLDTIDTFRPFLSIILNISPDHLSRYSSYEDYVSSKMRIFKNQKAGEYVVLNDDDERLYALSLPGDINIFRYGLGAGENRHAFIEGQDAKVCIDGSEDSYFSLKSYSLPGRHNIENLLATVLVGKILGADDNAIQRTLDEFRSLPNRLEKVGEKNGVAFYNDSKATNVDSAVRAVLSFDRPIILIAGGRHKGADYSSLIDAAQGRVKKANFLGEAKELLALSFKGIIPFSMVDDMEEAVYKSYSEAESGDVILLAPACSSFDMFLDYSHRGSVFASHVKRLIDNG